MVNYLFDEDIKSEDVMRNVKRLMQIRRGSIPLARGMGVKFTALSQIAPDLENDYAVDLVEQITLYEPRAEIDNVEFEYDNAGKVTVNIEIVKGDEYDDDE